MTYDIVYRPDGVMVLDHAADDQGNLSCGQPRYTGETVPAGDTPACPECLRALVKYITDNA